MLRFYKFGSVRVLFKWCCPVSLQDLWKTQDYANHRESLEILGLFQQQGTREAVRSTQSDYGPSRHFDDRASFQFPEALWHKFVPSPKPPDGSGSALSLLSCLTKYCTNDVKLLLSANYTDSIVTTHFVICTADKDNNHDDIASTINHWHFKPTGLSTNWD